LSHLTRQEVFLKQKKNDCRRRKVEARESKSGRPGTDVMIFKIFSPKNSAKKIAFLTQNKSKLCKILIITLVFEKNADFFAENCQKSQKIVIITSTPDKFVKKIA
jgi:hypothetical protein